MTLLALLLPLGCPSSSDGPPVGGGATPESCTPAPALDGAVKGAYVERTAEWGLSAVHGGRYTTADLDGDGYPDLVATEIFANARDDLGADLRYHYVMMNRDDGQGGRTFVDETEASGLVHNREGSFGTSHTQYVFGDLDNDGDLDAVAGRAYDAGVDDATGDCTEAYLNDGQGHFTLTATASDICIPTGYPTAGLSLTDADGDGVLDLWVTGWYLEYGYQEAAQAHLYRGQGDGRFTDVTDDAGLKLRSGRTDDYAGTDDRRPAFGATACDLDGDLFPELLSTNYGRAWNHQWMNQGDGTFVEAGQTSGFAADDNLDYSDNWFYACWCDAYGPCDPEPTVTCPAADYASYWAPGVDDQAWRLGGNSFTTVCADMDNDGDNDLYTAEICHDWAGESSDPSQLLLNDGAGSFTRVPNEDVGLARRRPRSGWNEGDIYAAPFDLDNDGWKDLLLVSTDYPDTQLWTFRQVAPGQFEELSSETGLDQAWPGGVAIADFDRDGDLDVVTGSSTARSGTPWDGRWAHLYENTLPASNWVQVAGLPVGSRVEVQVGELTQVQEVSGGYGTYGIQNDVVLHFGLGEACMIDRITASTPDGRTATWEDKAGNQRLQLSLDEGAGG